MLGCRPNSNYLLSSVASHDTTTCQSNAPTYRKYEHTQFHSGMGTQTQTDCAYIFLSLIHPHLELYQTIWLVKYMLYRLESETSGHFLHWDTVFHRVMVHVYTTHCSPSHDYKCIKTARSLMLHSTGSHSRLTGMV